MAIRLKDAMSSLGRMHPSLADVAAYLEAYYSFVPARTGELDSRLATLQAQITGIYVPMSVYTGVLAAQTGPMTALLRSTTQLLGCGYNASRVSPEPTVTGTKRYITPSTSIAQVNAMSVSAGDAVLFQAGGTWQMASLSDRLRCKSGVYYGRYGTGNNPVFDANFGGTWSSSSWYGLIDVNGVSNVTVDGFEIRNAPAATPTNRVFPLYAQNNWTNLTVRNIYANKSSAGGIVFQSGSGLVFDNVRITAMGGAAHEALTISTVVGFSVSNVWSHNNSKAGINVKNNSGNGSVFNCVTSSTTSDPCLYMDKTYNVHYYNNHVHRKDTLTNTRHLLVMGSELSSGGTQNEYCKDCSVHNNWITDGYGIGVYIRIHSSVTSTAASIIDNIRIYNNTIANVSSVSWNGGVVVSDERAAPNTSQIKNVVIENNLIWPTAGDSVRYQSGAGVTVRNNMYKTGATGQLGTGAQYIANPMFVNAANLNYNLQGGSPATGYGAEPLLGCPI